MKLFQALALMVLACAVCATAQQGRRTRVASEPRAGAASVALFVNSNLDSARSLAKKALRQNPRDRDALFIEMEAAALAADTAGELDAALRLCESVSPASAKSGPMWGTDDVRVTIAAARVLDLAGNTRQFRAVLPRVRRLIGLNTAQASALRMALFSAAVEGVPGLSPLALSREAGLLTEWQVAGPLGRYPNVAFDRRFAPEQDGLSQARYDGQTVEHFRFDDGTFSLAEYFSSQGIFYAASSLDVSTAGSYQLRLESAGTMEVFVDGLSVQRKDNRLGGTPEIVTAPVQLTPGTHRVLVKFIPSASPFRIAFFPHVEADKGATPAVADAAAGYVKAAEQFWMGNYDSAIAQLTELKRRQPSAAVDFLLAQAWSRSAPDSPEIPALLESTLKQSPPATAAEYELAELAYEAAHDDEAYRRARQVASVRPEFAPVQHLLADAALRLNWPAEAAQAFEAELRLRPVCSTVRSAARYFASIAEYERAAQLEKQLDGCAPGSLAYAEAQSEAGRHAEAAAAAQRVAVEQPLDRRSRLLLARELTSAGDTVQAEKVMAALARLAPNGRFQLPEQVSLRARNFGADEFYRTYRRNGLDVIRQTASRRFSGGPAVTVLHDRVAKLDEDGGVALYVHRITRVLNRDGIERYGEVRLPNPAHLLELRTIKQDGTIVEPEFSQHKNTISMPALAPGDAIEEEYVVRYGLGGISEHPDAFSYTFGSFAAPILYARFVALTPDRDMVVTALGAPAVRTLRGNGIRIHTWEQESIAQSTEEVSAPRTGTLPTVRMLEPRPGEWRDLRDFYRDTLMAALRVGPRVRATARTLRGTTPEETARNLYRMVTTRLRSTQSAFDVGEVASAEDTLANYAGSRTAALMAMARAEGIDAELLLAREVARQRPTAPEQDAYSHPLVLFRFGNKTVAADAETAGLAFGVVPPTLSHGDALSVPLGEEAAKSAQMMVALPASTGDEMSVADGDVTFDAEGNLSARLTIRMGASRGSQMRSILSGIQPAGRRQFFEQLALRIFPGVVAATGEVQNEHDAERPLILLVNCKAPRFLAFNGSIADMEQLAPALGLRKMYGLGTRQLPLYIDMPLIERTVFRVHLPNGFKLVNKAADLRLENGFGAYALELKQVGENELNIVREFRIPVQVISPERFGSFANFARQIDEAERQRMTVGQVAVTTASTSGK